MDMNTVSQVRIQNIEKPPAQSGEAAKNEAAAEPSDSVTVSKEKSLARKIGEAIVDFPIKVLEFGVSTVTGTAYAAKNLVPGALEGINEGVTDHKGRGRTGWFTFGTIGEFTAGGAAVGFTMGGPISAAIGAGVGLLSGLLLRGFEALTGADDMVVKAVEDRVDKAIQDNTTGTPIQIATRNATEGMIDGSVTGVTAGWKLGRSFGKGLVSGLRGAADGAKEAIFGK